MATPRYLKSDTRRVYTNPMADPNSAAVFEKTMNPMGDVAKATPPQQPLGVSDAGYELPTPKEYQTVDEIDLSGMGVDTNDYEGLMAAYAKLAQTQGFRDYEAGQDNSTDVKDDSSSSARATTYAQRTVVDAAKSYVGQNRYVYGGFDCSKFVQEVASKSGEKIPRSTATQIAYFKSKRRLVGINQARAGDIIFMQSGASPSGRHVGIYIGNGKMIDNSGRGKPIAVRSIKGRKIIGFGRLSIKQPAPKVTSGGRVGTSNYRIN